MQAIDVIKQAVNEGNPQKYSLILTDDEMPFCNGFDASAEMRKLW